MQVVKFDDELDSVCVLVARLVRGGIDCPQGPADPCSHEQGYHALGPRHTPAMPAPA